MDRNLVEACRPLLPAGARIRQILAAQTTNAWLSFFLGLLVLPGLIVFGFVNRNRLLAVCDEGIYVLDCGHVGLKPKGVLAVLPRATQLTMKLRVGKETLHVGSRWRSQVKTANIDKMRLMGPPPPAFGAGPPLAA